MLMVSKYCEKCKRDISNEGASFCPTCGGSLVIKTDTMEESTTVSNECKKMSFQKKKMFTYLVYRCTSTEVTIENQMMHLSQTVKKIFRKERTTETNIPMTEIKDISIKTKMDLWDTLYGIIFIILGFFAPVFFLLAALFLFCGYGKIIQIEQNNGIKYLIPSDLKTDDVERLMTLANGG